MKRVFEYANRIRKYRPLIITLSAVVVFVTTYLLILPALTLDEDAAAEQGGIDVPEAVQTVESQEAVTEETQAAGTEETAGTAGTVTCDSGDYRVLIDYGEGSGLTEDTGLAVEEIGKSGDGKASYEKYRKLALGAVREATGVDSVNIEMARFFDITLEDENGETEPSEAVDVTIDLEKHQAVSGDGEFHIVHFTKDGKSGKLRADVLDEDDACFDVRKDRVHGASFTADSFSVYGIVYTVDLELEYDGRTYSFSLEGGDSTSIGELFTWFEIIEKDERADFVEDIEKVEFSSPEYVWTGRLEEGAFAGDIKRDNDLDVRYSAEMKKGNIMAMDAHYYPAHDWVLVALKPFRSEETLTVTMKSGHAYTFKVTDDQDDAIHKEDGTVQTIPNPQGTTFDLFNYYVSSDTKTTAGRDQWPGHIHDPDNDGKFNWYDLGGNYVTDYNEGYNRGYSDNDEYLLGNGNDLGINADHAFKFSPANDGTVIDGARGTKNKAGDGSGLNSYMGDADPRRGIVEDTLTGGYPTMTSDQSLGTDGTSLAYLFDATEVEGKDRYGDVNQLLYVDKDGYYTYDSRDFKAEYQADGTFKVSDQPDTGDSEVKGFWPFGERVFWAGLHMQTQFSIPENGQVLNPKDELKDMQFEFSGDDDTWLYIDGVLVGDGGGIHNRTEIDVNFATGKVTVTGKKDPGHMGSFEETKWLDDIFKAAGRYYDDEWEEIPGTDHKRFKAGTYHTFDMFYLERGGGESNLYIHYNLVSTEDFTGHKSFEGFADDERMSRNQFHFEMIGLDGQYRSVWNEATQTETVTKLNDDGRAIMPVNGREDGAGTFQDPKKVYSQEAYTYSGGGGETVGGTVFSTGVTENGDIRFGKANISAEERLNCDEGHPSLYRYIIREKIPDDAVNEDGVTWAEATDEQKAAGGFVKDQIRYDNKVYYMTARVTSWQQLGSDGQLYTEYGLSKTYYTDDTFTEKDDTVSFVDFRNRYAPDAGRFEFTKVDGAGHPLQGAEFTLYTDKACTKVAKDLGDPESGIDPEDQIKTSGGDGKVVFENLAAPRTYYMKETAAPSGYQPNDTVYKVTVESPDDETKKSKIVILDADPETEITKIVNTKEGELSVRKNWVDEDGNAISGADKTARVQLRRYKYVVDPSSTQKHTLTLNCSYKDYNGIVHTGSQQFEFTGSEVQVVWKVVGGAAPKVFTGFDEVGWDQSIPASVFTKRFTGVTGDISHDIELNEYWPINNGNFSFFDSFEIIDASSAGPSMMTVPDEDFPAASDEGATVTLSSANDWTHLWKIGNEPGNDYPASGDEGRYLYYVVELGEDGQVVEVGGSPAEGTTLKSIVYSPARTDGAGIPSGAVTVTNETTVPEAVPIDICVTKYDSEDMDSAGAAPLPGATFRLEKYTSSAYQSKDPEWTEQTAADNEGTGTFSFTGLGAGHYKLVEVSGPAGYIRITGDPTFEVRDDGSGSLEVIFTDTDLVKYTSDAGFRVGNQKGAALPHTGGPGTTPLYMLGALMILLSGGALAVRRRLAG